MTDETNLNPGREAKFFIYGGLMMPMETVSVLHAGIEGIRQSHGFEPGDALKFSTNTRPTHVDMTEWTAAKDEVIQLCLDSGVTFIAYLILHDIATGGHDRMIEFAVNTLLYVFDRKYLIEKDDDGIVIVDRLPGSPGFDLLKRKFTQALPIGDRTVRIPRVKLFAATCDGASHVSSAVDIVLGAFRYCVNQTGDTPVPARLFPLVAKMMWHRLENDTRYLREYGLLLRPVRINVPVYRAEYDALVARFIAFLEAAEDDDEKAGS